MIYNMHIRHDWQKWLTPEQKYVKALCGANTTNKYAGVPGVSKQPWRISAANGRPVQAWCGACSAKMYDQLMLLPEILYTSPSLVRQYNIALNIICQVSGVVRSKTFTVKPVRGTQDSRDSSAEKREWKEYWRRKPCYLCQLDKGRVTSIDHIIPTAHGGPDEWWNKGMTHFDCNSKKGDLSMQEVYEAFPNVVFPERFIANLT